MWQIKRPYFHAKPLDKYQLQNWHDYLDFEVAEGNHKRTVFLFERCVIACAMYEEFWMKVSVTLQHSASSWRALQLMCMWGLLWLAAVELTVRGS